MKVLVTGSAGFVMGYLVEELLQAGYEVIGVDNFSKYGQISHRYDSHPRYQFVSGDCRDSDLMKRLVSGCDQLVAGAAMIGGIAYLHQFAYDLLAANERITASTFDAAISEFQHGKLSRIIVVSSSRVYEHTAQFPSREEDLLKSPPPSSTYGFQKLSSEYFAKGAWEQYELPCTIVRLFNCVGVGEKSAVYQKKEVLKDGNVNLALGHVIPDLILKTLKGQDPLEILGAGSQIRHYTYGGDVARGIRLAMESDKAVNEDFNLASPVSTTILELAEAIWSKVHGHGKPFRYQCVEGYPYDVERRVPDITKAKRILNFEAKTSLDEMLDIVIAWISDQIKQGTF